MNLKEQIDVPMQRSVALLNLLGIRTYWSCCGFNYQGQEPWRSHDYGRPNIIVERTRESVLLGAEFLLSGLSWQMMLTNSFPPTNGPLLSFYANTPQVVPAWNTPQSVHFHEIGAQLVGYMEKFLETRPKERFRKTVLLDDTNALAKEKIKYWDFPAADSGWLLVLEDFL